MRFNLKTNEVTLMISWENLDCAVREKALLRSLDSLSTLGNHYSNFICLRVEGEIQRIHDIHMLQK